MAAPGLRGRGAVNRLGRAARIGPILLLAAFGAVAAGLPLQPAFAEEAGLELGKQVFVELAEPRCALCHTLADAEAAGTIGPSLDTLRPDAARVEAAVVNGIGVMPAYGELLSEEQIDAVSAYVAAAVSQPK